MKMCKLFIYKLERLLKERYSHIPFEFYGSRRKKNIHFGLEKSLVSYENYANAIRDIQEFFKKQKNEEFEFVDPVLIHTVKWKFDYIIFRRKNCGTV